MAIRGNISEQQLALTDVTDNNVSTSKHGLTPKAPNDATKFLDGTGAYSVPAGSGGSVTHTGTLTSGQLIKGNGSADITVGDLTGDVTTSGGTITVLANIPNDTAMAGDLLATAVSAPSTPASGKGRVYVDSTSKNLAIKNDAGVVNHGIKTLASSTGQFVSAIDDDGTVHTAVPAGSSGAGSFFGIANFTAPPSSGWTWDNQTTSTINSTSGYEYLHAVATALNQLTIRYRTAPATPYTVTAFILHDLTGYLTTNSTNTGIGLFFRQSTTGKIVDLRLTSNAGSQGIVTTKWASSTSVTAAYTNITGTALTIGRGGNWLQIKDDGTNLIFSLSIDGNNWVQFDSRLRGDFLTTSGGVTGPDQIGFGAYINGANVEMALVSWVVA